MAKILVALLLALLAFVGTLLGALAATGNLSKEGFDKILNRGEPEPAAAGAASQEQLDPLLKAIEERETRLKEKAEALEKRAEQLDIRERDLEELREELQRVYTQFTESLDQADATHEERLRDVAKSLAGMSPENAAQVLQEWPPSEAARILRDVDEGDRGDILDEMEADKAALILRALQERAY